MSAAALIHKLNPKIRGWANYHRHVVSTRTFARVDHHIFSSLGDGHDEDTRTRPHAGANGSILHDVVAVTGPSSAWDDEGQPSLVWLRHARSTLIRRQVKVKGDANPYDPAYEIYFEQREGDHMQETFRGSRTLRFLWHEQPGFCTVCNNQNHAPSPLRCPCDGWFAKCGEPRSTSSGVP